MIYYDYDSYSKNTAAYLLSCQRYMELISPPAFTPTISKHQADRMQESRTEKKQNKTTGVEDNR